MVSDYISQLSPGAKHGSKISQVASHPAKVELGYSGVLSLKSRILPKFAPSLFNGMSDALDFRMLGNPAVIVVLFVNPARIGTDKRFLQFAQFRFVFYKPKHDRL